MASSRNHDNDYSQHGREVTKVNLRKGRFLLTRHGEYSLFALNKVQL